MNLFELFVKIAVDDQASGKISTLSGKLSNGLKTAANIGLKAVGAAMGGIATLATSAIKNYAEYEQLVGGVDILFKNSSKKLQEYAASAYKTAGMSANEYMETATSFAGSLLQSLEGDTEQAAEYANMAITDMADNANTMGTSMEMIQNAYQGFAKQNYTMLDNLKLGYGGTKTEMERLLKDADRLSDKFNLVEDENGELVYSFDDIVQAIHIVQEEMGITGKTSEEASKTISGSVASMKSAWSNLIIGIADDNADFESLMDAFVATIVGEDGEGGVINNIAPKIETAFDGVLKLVEKLTPKIIGALPEIINKYLPDLVNTAISVVSLIITSIGENSDSLSESLVSAISTIISHAAENTPDLIGAVLDLVLSIISELGNNLGTIVTEVVSSIGYVLAEVAKRAPELTDAVFSIVNGLVDLVTSPENAGLMTTAGLELMLSLLAGMALSIPQLVNNVGAIIDTIKNNFTYAGWEESGEEMASQIGSSFNSKWAEIKKEYSEMWADFTDVYNAATLSTGKFLDGLWAKIKSFFDGIWSKLTGIYNNVTESVGSFFNGLWETITGFFSNANSNMSENFETIWSKIKEFLDKPGYYIGYAIGAVVDAVQTFFTETIPNAWDSFTGWLTEGINSIVSSVQTFFTVTIPNAWNSFVNWLTTSVELIAEKVRTFFNETIPNAWNGLIKKITTFFGEIKGKIVGFFTETIPQEWGKFKNNATEKINSIKDWFSDLPEKLKEVGKNIVDGLWKGIKDAWEWLTSEVGGLLNDLVQGIKDGLGIKSPSRVFASIGENMALGVGKGWDETFGDIKGEIDKSLKFDNILTTGTGAGFETLGTSNATTFGGITFNIYANDFSSIDEMADAIMDRINDAVLTREETYA